MKIRQSNFELLRIISMMMIIGLHYFHSDMGGAFSAQSPGNLNFYITFLFESLFIVSVNCFVLITGYFQINKKSFFVNKVMNLLLIMMFYGFLFYGIAVMANWTSFSLKGLIVETVPILFGYKWFIQTYIVLYMLSPFLNKLLNGLSLKDYNVLLLILLFLFSFYPSFIPSPPVTDGGYGIISFVLLYSIGGYLRNYYSSSRNKVFYLLGYIFCGFITFLLALLINNLLGSAYTHVWKYNFIFNVFGSIFLFIYFSKLDIKSNLINKVATYSLGVYFVHTSPITYNFLYRELLQTYKFWHSPLFILHAFGSIFLVYTFATFIDIGRKSIFDFVGIRVNELIKKYLPFLFKELP